MCNSRFFGARRHFGSSFAQAEVGEQSKGESAHRSWRRRRHPAPCNTPIISTFLPLKPLIFRSLRHYACPMVVGNVILLACCAPKYRQGARQPKETGRNLSGWRAHHFAVVRLVAEHLGRHVPVGARLTGHVVAPGRRALHARAQAAAGAAAAAVPALRLILCKFGRARRV